MLYFWWRCREVWMITLKAGLRVRRKHKHKHKQKPRVNWNDASTSARSFFLCLCLRCPGSHVDYPCACACACVVRVNQPLGLKGLKREIDIYQSTWRNMIPWVSQLISHCVHMYGLLVTATPDAMKADAHTKRHNRGDKGASDSLFIKTLRTADHGGEFHALSRNVNAGQNRVLKIAELLFCLDKHFLTCFECSEQFPTQWHFLQWCRFTV